MSIAQIALLPEDKASKVERGGGSCSYLLDPDNFDEVPNISWHNVQGSFFMLISFKYLEIIVPILQRSKPRDRKMKWQVRLHTKKKIGKRNSRPSVSDYLIRKEKEKIDLLGHIYISGWGFPPITHPL
jgi:hypothetical protein